MRDGEPVHEVLVVETDMVLEREQVPGPETRRCRCVAGDKARCAVGHVEAGHQH
jgi:hypothetical protein